MTAMVQEQPPLGPGPRRATTREASCQPGSDRTALATSEDDAVGDKRGIEAAGIDDDGDGDD